MHEAAKAIILGSSRSVYGEGAYTLSYDPGSIVTAAIRTREALDEGRWEPVDETGRPLTPVPTPENFPFAPGSIYAATKAAQELLLISSSIALGMRATIFRFQNVYGEGQSLRNPTRESSQSFSIVHVKGCAFRCMRMGLNRGTSCTSMM